MKKSNFVRDIDTNIHASSKSLIATQQQITTPNNNTNKNRLTTSKAQILLGRYAAHPSNKKFPAHHHQQHYKTLSPKSNRFGNNVIATTNQKQSEKSSFFEPSNNSGGDLLTVLKDKVLSQAQRKNVTGLFIPKISSAYSKTNYKFKTKHLVQLDVGNNSEIQKLLIPPTQNQIRQAVKSQLPVFGYNCEKKNSKISDNLNAEIIKQNRYTTQAGGGKYKQSKIQSQQYSQKVSPVSHKAKEKELFKIMNQGHHQSHHKFISAPNTKTASLKLNLDHHRHHLYKKEEEGEQGQKFQHNFISINSSER